MPRRRTLIVALIAGCAMLGQAGAADARKRTKISEYAPVLAPPLPATTANGAIFQAANGYAPLTSGSRASMVGDLLTITLVERTQAAKTSASNTDRSGNIGLTPPTTGPLSLFSPSDAAVSGGAKFDGKGAATQSNQLNGELSVTIAQVYPNGTMLIRGEKMLTLNRGDEQIRISGIVRAADIGPDNRILSTRVADAKISYSGKGDIARASRQGWLSHFFSILSPF
jgi:flagellar L-ring protein precursor FlgH